MVNAREAAGEGHSRASFSVPRETAYSALTHRRQQVMSRSLFTYLIIICEVCYAHGPTSTADCWYHIGYNKVKTTYKSSAPTEHHSGPTIQLPSNLEHL